MSMINDKYTNKDKSNMNTGVSINPTHDENKINQLKTVFAKNVKVLLLKLSTTTEKVQSIQKSEIHGALTSINIK